MDTNSPHVKFYRRDKKGRYFEIDNPTYKAVETEFDRSKLGRMIGRGKEQRVYDSGDGYVYKVYGKNAPNSTM
jgi:hypothetical protein